MGISICDRPLFKWMNVCVGLLAFAGKRKPFSWSHYWKLWSRFEAFSIFQKADDFSNFQVARLMHKSRLSRKIDHVRRELNAESTADLAASLSGHAGYSFERRFPPIWLFVFWLSVSRTFCTCSYLPVTERHEEMIRGDSCKQENTNTDWLGISSCVWSFGRQESFCWHQRKLINWSIKTSVLFFVTSEYAEAQAERIVSEDAGHYILIKGLSKRHQTEHAQHMAKWVVPYDGFGLFSLSVLILSAQSWHPGTILDDAVFLGQARLHVESALCSHSRLRCRCHGGPPPPCWLTPPPWLATPPQSCMWWHGQPYGVMSELVWRNPPPAGWLPPPPHVGCLGCSASLLTKHTCFSFTVHATLVGLPWNVNMPPVPLARIMYFQNVIQCMEHVLWLQNQKAVRREAWTIFMEIARDMVDELAVANAIIAVPGGNATLNQPVMRIVNNQMVSGLPMCHHISTRGHWRGYTSKHSHLQVAG